MKTSAGILSYEIYNQEGKNELSISPQKQFTQLLKLKLRNASPYHQVLFKSGKIPHLTLKFKKGILPTEFKKDGIKIFKYRLIKGSDLFSQAALEGYLFDKEKMEQDENFQVDIQKVLDTIDTTEGTRSVVPEGLPFGIDNLLQHFNNLKPEEKTTTYKWIGQLDQLQKDYKAALAGVKNLTISNDAIKANPLFVSIIQEVATVFEKLIEVQQNSVDIEHSLDLLAKQVHEQQKADIQSLEANFQKNYQNATQSLVKALKTSLKTIIVEALHGTKMKDITNLQELTLNEDIIKKLEQKVFIKGAVQNSDWTTDITQSADEDAITFTCKKEITLHPNEYLLMDFELIGALKGTAKSVATELNYENLVFQKNGTEDTTVKDKISQATLNLVNDGAFGIPPNLELLVAEGKNILNNGEYENTIALNLINQGQDDIILSDTSKLQLSFYTQQENEAVAYALQSKDDNIGDAFIISKSSSQLLKQLVSSDIFNLVKKQNSLDVASKKTLLNKSDKSLLITNIDLSSLIQTTVDSNTNNRFRAVDKVVNRIYKLLGSNKSKAFRLNKNYFAIYDSFTNDYSFNGAYIFELDYENKGDVFYYNIYYQDVFNYDFKNFKFIDKIKSTKYLGRIKVLSIYKKDKFIIKLGVENISDAQKLANVGSVFQSVQIKNDNDLKTFLQKNKTIISNQLGLDTSSLTSIGSSWGDFDAIFYKNYTVATNASNSTKTIQYTGVIGVKKVNDQIIELYQPTPSANGAIDLETYAVSSAIFKINNNLGKTPVVTEGMELVGTFWQGTSTVLVKSASDVAIDIQDDLILSTLPSYETLQGLFVTKKIDPLNNITNSSNIQTTFEKPSLNLILPPYEALEIRLTNIKTQLPVGAANIKVSLLNIPNYKDAHLSTTVNRVSFLSTTQKGIFTTGTNNDNITIIQDNVDIKTKNYSFQINENGLEIYKNNNVIFAVNDLMYKVLPVGAVMMWSGDSKSIPKGWAICDGQYPTPDLTSRFVVGAAYGYGDTATKGFFQQYKRGDTGGEENVKLKESQIPSHNHEVTDGDYYLKNWKTGTKSSGAGIGEKMMFATDGTYSYTSEKYTKSVGGGEAHENRPPYHALFYIMRVEEQNILTKGERLYKGQALQRYTKGNLYKITLQYDGNLVIHKNGNVKWAASSNNWNNEYLTLINGDLVIYDNTGNTQWKLSSKNPPDYTINSKAQTLKWSSDGHLYFYDLNNNSLGYIF